MSARFHTVLLGLFSLALTVGCGSSPEIDSPPPESSVANDGPTAAEVMEKMVAVYREAESYMDNAEYGEHFVFTSDGVQRQGPPIMVSVLFERPNRFRITRHEPKSDGKAERTLVVSNGEKFQATITALYPQQLESPAPEAATVDTVAPDPLLRKALFPVPVADIFPQLDLLLSPDAKNNWLPKEQDSLVMLPSKDLQSRGSDPRPCFLVQIPTTAGPQICWIDKTTFLLLRIELPSEELRQRLYPNAKFNSFAFRFDFYDALMGEGLPPEAFQLSKQEQGTEIVSEFREPKVVEETEKEETTESEQKTEAKERDDEGEEDKEPEEDSSDDKNSDEEDDE